MRLANKPCTSRDLTIVKGCEREFAIEFHGQLRMCTPAYYREDGDSLIWDLQECVVREPERVERRRDDSDDLRAHMLAETQLDSERSSTRLLRPASIAQLDVKETTSSTYAMGDNCLLWCAAYRPQNRSERSSWKKSLDPKYDHVSTIRDPDAFAFALALEASEHIDQLESSVVFANPITKFEVACRNLSVIYGPIAYTHDRHAHIRDSQGTEEFMIRSIFTKSAEHRDQLEYRFAILSHRRLAHETLDLTVTEAMLEAVEGDSQASPQGLSMDYSDILRFDLPLKVRDCFAELPQSASDALIGRRDLRTDLRLELNLAGKQQTSTVRESKAVQHAARADFEGLDRAIAQQDASPDDARIAKITIDGGPGTVTSVYDLDGVRSELRMRTESGGAVLGVGTTGAASRSEILVDNSGFDGSFALGHDAQQLILIVVTANPDATVEIDQSCPDPNLPANHISLCDDGDTHVTVTATSADGSQTSSFEIVIDQTLSRANDEQAA